MLRLGRVASRPNAKTKTLDLPWAVSDPGYIVIFRQIEMEMSASRSLCGKLLKSAIHLHLSCGPRSHFSGEVKHNICFGNAADQPL